MYGEIARCPFSMNVVVETETNAESRVQDHVEVHHVMLTQESMEELMRETTEEQNHGY